MALDAIIDAYVRRIDRKVITIDDVPEPIRDAVKAAMINK